MKPEYYKRKLKAIDFIRKIFERELPVVALLYVINEYKKLIQEVQIEIDK